MAVTIVVVNNSTLMTLERLQRGLAAINAQIAEDFAPRWGTSGQLVLGSAPIAGAYTFFMQDGIDIKADIGYHTLQSGEVIARIDAQGAMAAGMDPLIALGHEVLEALADPLTTRFAPDGVTLCEVCDPVQVISYMKDAWPDVPLTDFVLPNYMGFNSTLGPYDFCGKLEAKAPATAPGGACEQYVGGQYVMHAMRTPAGAFGYFSVRPHGRRLFRAQQAA